MRSFFAQIISLFFVFLFNSCLIDIPENIDWNTDNYKPGIIAESLDLLAFPDLINYNNTWFICYREADDHGFKTFSKIKVLVSDDFKNWRELNEFELDGWDLRDPKFSYNDYTDELYLHIHAASTANKVNRYAIVRKDLYAVFNLNVNSFGDESDLNELKVHINHPINWKWRPKWHKNNLFVVGYLNYKAQFYRYKSINDTPNIFAEMNNAGETTLFFENDSLYFITRTSNFPRFGKLEVDDDELISFQDDTNFTIMQDELKMSGIGGPNMIIKDSIAYIGGRVLDENSSPRTMLYKYSLKDKSLVHLETFISMGDNSYPGLVLKDNSIYGCYYTLAPNYRGYQIRSFIRPF